MTLTAALSDLSAFAVAARRWLVRDVLPLWWTVGADRDHGGYFEAIGQDGIPVRSDKRFRVQARQAFVYAHAARFGWDGPAAAAVRHGIDHMLTAYRRSDGLFRTRVTVDGRIANDDFDLYDQAFALLGLNAAWRVLGEARYRDEARALLALLDARLTHPAGGFEEDFPPRLPLRSNPHMHMLEALLAWVGTGEDAPFRAHADAITRLALTHMIDPATGAIGEYFNAAWAFEEGPAGAVREPGHQFEWSFLLGESARILGGDHGAVCARLYRFGADHGIDAARGVAMFALDAQGHVTDPDARLWSQTEWLRTAYSRGDGAGALAAARALARFCDVPVAGLWRDRMLRDGTMADGPAPASSLYHIVSALLPLLPA